MKTAALLTFVLAAVASAHTIFQKVSVNGQDQGQLKGVRAPSSDYPIENVNDGSFACNKNIQYKDNTIINIPVGAKVGAWWGHVIGGPQGANDPDHPIAASHKGPIIVYLAKVDNAASAGTSGLQWFKVSEEGLSGGRWAVDNMISNGGWNYFTMPSCIAPGNYLMRVELIALHNAYSSGGAQFYMECAQINVTGGSGTMSGQSVSFPGAYSSSDPGIQLSIYGTSGTPDNAGKAYKIPGPAVISCSGGGGSSPQPSSSSSNPPAATNPPSSGGGSVQLYGQCGGNGYSGPTTCAQGTCKASNEWYSQCIP